jgi:hypothetical protein
MRHIHLGEGLRLRFPGRGEEFNLGVEIGMIAALMEAPLREFTRRIASANLEQARALADGLGFRLLHGPAEGEWVDVTFRYGKARPSLRLVHSRGDEAQPEVA